MIYIVSSFLPTYFKFKKNNDYVIGLGTKENTSISTISSSDYIVQTHEYASMVFGQLDSLTEVNCLLFSIPI